MLLRGSEIGAPPREAGIQEASECCTITQCQDHLNKLAPCFSRAKKFAKKFAKKLGCEVLCEKVCEVFIGENDPPKGLARKSCWQGWRLPSRKSLRRKLSAEYIVFYDVFVRKLFRAVFRRPGNKPGTNFGSGSGNRGGTGDGSEPRKQEGTSACLPACLPGLCLPGLCLPACLPACLASAWPLPGLCLPAWPCSAPALSGTTRLAPSGTTQQADARAKAKRQYFSLTGLLAASPEAAPLA